MFNESQALSESSSPLQDINKRPSYLEISTTQHIQHHFDGRVIRCLENQFSDVADDEAEPIKTYLRIRPYVRKANDEFDLLEIKDESTVVANYQAPGTGRKKVMKKMEFKFSKVLDQSCSQEFVFDQSIAPLLDRFDLGENCLVFSYGATNSGKTYTMRGSATKYGIIPRTLYHVFDRHQERIYKGSDVQPFRHESTRALQLNDQRLILEKKKMLINTATDTLEMKQRPKIIPRWSDASSHCAPIKCVGAAVLNSTTGDRNNTLFSMWISFVELYNEKCYDLLVPTGPRKEVKIVSERAGSYSYFKDITELPVFSEEEAYALYVAGYKKLEVSSTQANQNSSRSHSFFTIRVVELGQTDKSVYPIKVHRMTFCDLAGCERIRQTENTGGQLRESANINQSLLSLLKVIRMIRTKQSNGQAFLEKIPFRESKLTRIFQGYFSTSTHIAMIVNVNPSPKMADSSIQTLSNSAIASNIVAFRPKPQMQIIVEDVFHNSFLHSSMDLEDVMEEDENEEENCSPPPANNNNVAILNNHNRDVEILTPRHMQVLKEKNKAVHQINSPSGFKKPTHVDQENNNKNAEHTELELLLRGEIGYLRAQLKQKDEIIKMLKDQVKTVESETREQMLKEMHKQIQSVREIEQRRKLDWSGSRPSQFSSRFCVNTETSTTQTEWKNDFKK